jgi:hypothetical protein
MNTTRMKTRLDRLEQELYIPRALRSIDLNVTVGKLLAAFGYPGCEVVPQGLESQAEAFCRTVQIDPRDFKTMLMQRLRA